MNICDMDSFVVKEIFAARQKLQKHPMTLIIKPVDIDLFK